MWSEYQAVVAEVDKLIGEHASYSHFQGCLFDLSLLLLAACALWLVSVLLDRPRIADAIWPAWPVVLASSILYRSPMREVAPKQALLLAVVGLWSARLGLHLLTTATDWRHAQLKELFGKRAFTLASLPVLFLGKAALVMAACLPMYAALRNRFSQMSEGDLTGLFVMLVGVLVETYADELVSQQQQQQPGGKLVQTGPWSWCRHPNYFGEWLFWVGLWLFSGLDPVGAVGPVLVLFVLVAVSAPLLEEHHLEVRREQYEPYVQRVRSSFFPLFWM